MANNWKALSGVPAGLTPETMLLLSDGSVLVHNAYGAEWWRLRPSGAGKFDAGSWSGPFKMAHARQFFASGVVKDGRVFVIGGEYLDGSSTPVDSPLAELFDPLTETWSAMNKPSAYDQINGDVSACILADGRVLCGSLNTSLTATWDPVLDAWTTVGTGFGSTGQTRIGGCDEETWTLLPDGTVLTVGIASPESAQKYDPASDTWVPADISPPTLSEQLALISLSDTTVTPPVSVNIGELVPPSCCLTAVCLRSARPGTRRCIPRRQARISRGRGRADRTCRRTRAATISTAPTATCKRRSTRRACCCRAARYCWWPAIRCGR